LQQHFLAGAPCLNAPAHHAPPADHGSAALAVANSPGLLLGALKAVWDNPSQVWNHVGKGPPATEDELLFMETDESATGVQTEAAALAMQWGHR